jgi:PAS domain S-box-containing protein
MKLRFTLQIKLLILIIGVTALVSTILIVQSLVREREIFQTHFKDKATTLALSFDASIGSFEELRNSSKLQSTIYKFLWLYPELVKISIGLPTSTGIEIIASNRAEEIGKNFPKETFEVYQTGKVLSRVLISSEGTKFFSLFTPIHIGGQRAGVYEIVLSLEAEEKAIAARQREVTLTLVGSFFVLILLLSLSFRRMIILPLVEVKKGLEKFKAGDLSWRIIPKSEDEIGDLSRGFNEMAENIERFNQRLKEKLAEATKDLQIKIKELEETRIALMNMLEDIEEARKGAEEEKNKTLAIIENFADGLLVFDKEGKLSLINPQAEQFFGVKSVEVVGKSILELGIFPSIKPIVEIIGKEIRGVFRKEVQIKGSLILEITTIPIMREEEKLGSLIILHDVTREKEIERMKTEFVSISAHQLRTPLSAIKWTLKMFLDGDLGKITKEQREFLEKTYKSNERMINLINDLLNVTRIEEGRYLYRPVLADIVPICQSVIDSYKEEIEKKKLKFEFKRPKELPKVRVDIEKISLAIQNLLENAILYNLPGGKVEISLKLKENKIEFSIKDTGIGIPKDQQKRVFTKFFRAPNAMRMETEGSGLGLFITKNIIEAHGGEIWFESEEGKGTTFYFTLPVARKT